MEIVDENFEEFEWDTDKHLVNLEKHKIDFEDIKSILTHPHFGKIDPRHEERRIISIGELRSATYVIVYTVRGNACRIISARKASRDERKLHQALRKKYSHWKN